MIKSRPKKLTPREEAAIRRTTSMSYRELAAKYNVSHTTIYNIKK